MDYPVFLPVLTILLLCGIHLNLAAPVAAREIDSHPVINCGPIYMTITFLKKNLTDLKVNVANIHLIDPSCRQSADNETAVMIQSVVKEGFCGTKLEVNGTHALYMNNVTLPTAPSPVINREEYIASITCAYPLDMNVSLQNALNPINSTKIIQLGDTGNFRVNMVLFRESAYSIPREQEDYLSMQNMMYIGVYIAEGDTSQFNLVLQNCFATPTANFNDTLKYDIILNSCQNKIDTTIQIPANGKSSVSKFSVQAFKFIGDNDEIYLHCGVHLCDNSAPCEPDCSSVSSSSGTPSEQIISLGPLRFSGSPETTNTDIHPVFNCGPIHMTITFLKKNLTDLKVNAANIHLIDPVCHQSADDETTVMIQSVVEEGACGTKLEINDTYAVYMNNVTLPAGPSSVTYREEYVISVTCAYPLDMNVSLENAVHPIMSTKIIQLGDTGNFRVNMALFRDSAYSIPREQEDYLSMQNMMYIGVYIAEGDTSQFNLVLQNCFATPTVNFNDTLKYDIIINSCQNKDDSTINISENGKSSVSKFSVQAFKFIGDYDEIFLHCGVHLCNISVFCEPNCTSVSSGSDTSSEQIISLGPLRFSAIPETTTTTGSPGTSNSVVTRITTAVSQDSAVTITTASNITEAVTATTKSSAGKRTYMDYMTVLAVLLCWRM